MTVMAGGYRLKVERLESAAATHAAADRQMQLWALDRARETEYQHRLAVGEIDARLTKAQSAHDEALHVLGAARSAGTVRVRDDRKCPAAHVPATEPATSGSHGAEGIYLPPEAEQRVLRLTAEADRNTEQLTACQAYVQSLQVAP
ncbi:lysis system i-spanin subunit Rz [Lysobacter korlensis]|uniref:Lysis system i-spanin subunit Rz n=1 Tax=Lysobacter korlensis TaxID=553636 RepID=A0ABV6RNJ9_9GAMM